MNYEVVRTQQTTEGVVYVMKNGRSVVVGFDGNAKARNTEGRGIAPSGRFAADVKAMMRAVFRFQTA